MKYLAIAFFCLLASPAVAQVPAWQNTPEWQSCQSMIMEGVGREFETRKQAFLLAAEIQKIKSEKEVLQKAIDAMKAKQTPSKDHP